MDHQTIKYIRSLHQKKHRQLHGAFLVEGVKLVTELLDSDFAVKAIYTTDPNLVEKANIPVEVINEKTLKRISTLENPNKAVAVAKLPHERNLPEDISQKLSLILEKIQDPGNLGTIIRLANWYGIEHILCSEDTVECYNPKVVQSTMGALFRVNIQYTDIYSLIDEATAWPDFGIYATHLAGDSIYNTSLKSKGFIIMGNESAGLSGKIDHPGVHKIKLPPFPPEKTVMESLNVAIAAAITVAEFRRRMMG